MEERLNGIQEVVGSIPIVSTRFSNEEARGISPALFSSIGEHVPREAIRGVPTTPWKHPFMHREAIRGPVMKN